LIGRALDNGTLWPFHSLWPEGFTFHRDCEDGTSQLSRIDGALLALDNSYLTPRDIKVLAEMDCDHYPILT